MADVFEYARKNLAAGLAREYDNAVMEGLRRYLGAGHIDLDRLRGRLTRIGPNGGAETLCLDGVPFLRLGPLETDLAAPPQILTYRRTVTYLGPGKWDGESFD